MITFEFAYRGYDENLIDLAEIIAKPLGMDIVAALHLSHELIDVDQMVVLQATDEAFGQLTAGLLEAIHDGLFEADEIEIVVAHQEPDQQLHSIHSVSIRPVQLGGRPWSYPGSH